MYANEYTENNIDELSSDHDFDNRSPNKLTSKITTYLRWIGSVLIVLSAVSFMLEGHGELPAYRYWIGLGLTLLLCSGGMVCAYLFKETKGARIFFGLGTAFLSVQVSQVSAMIYGYWHGQNALQPEYSWLQFMDVSATVIAIDFVITGVLLILVSYACYSILARKYLKTLLWTSIVGNLVLMLPIRDPSYIPFIIAGLFVFFRHIELQLHLDNSMRLMEGLAARVLVSLPLWIIMGRSLLHPVSFMLATVIMAIAVVISIYDIKRYTKSALVIYIAQWIGTCAAITLWVNLIIQFADPSNPVNFLPVALILYVLSGQVDYHARLYRFFSAIITMSLVFIAMLSQQDMAVTAPMVSVAAGILLTISGIKYQEKIAFFVGNICVLGGLLFYWEYVVNFYSSAPWISSIVLGLFVILLASYLENKEKQILDKSRDYFNKLKEWD